MSQANIAHVILNMTHGGAETLVVELATGVDRSRFSPEVVCLDAIRGNTGRLEAAGVPYGLIPRAQVKFDARAAMNLSAHVRRRGIRLLHAHDMSSLAYAAFAGLRNAVPVVMTEHSRHYIDERRIRRLEKTFLSLFTRRIVEVSPHLAEASRARDRVAGRKLAVIENGVDLDLFGGADGPDGADGAAFRREIGASDGTFLIGMVGRLEEIKGPLYLLRAFSKIADRRPDVHLVYAGSGSQRDLLAETARTAALSDRVHLLGARTDAPKIMRGLDAVILPSLSEGLPFALLEAMAAARPVAASAVGRIPQVVEPERSGLLFPPGDEDALARALLALTGDPEAARRMGRRGREIVAARYSLKNMVRAYESLYDETLGRVHGGRP